MKLFRWNCGCTGMNETHFYKVNQLYVIHWKNPDKP